MWNDHDKKMLGYIETKAKPVIFYLPKEHTLQTEELLAKTRDKIEGQCVIYIVRDVTDDVRPMR